MKTKTIGCDLIIEKANVHGIKVKPSTAYLENIDEKTARKVIKKNNLKVDESLLKMRKTEVGIIYDKKGGKAGYLLVLPKNPGMEKIIDINNGEGIDRLHAIRVLSALYL